MKLFPISLAVFLASTQVFGQAPPAPPAPSPPSQAARPTQPSQAPPPPFADESLRYSVNGPSGASLGEAQFLSRRVGERWRFALSLDAAIPGFMVSDSYQSTAAGEFCSVELVKTSAHGARKAEERTDFDAQTGVATRLTLSAGGGQSEIAAAGCSRDALTFFYFLRLELGQGRLPPPQTVLFGAPYQLRLERVGAETIQVKDRREEAERVRGSLKGPASETTFELLLAHDTARTPLMIRVPLKSGVFSLELVR
ncbi:MAG: DUF3108 domain-containing protein [Bryobacteraceae bacterium]